MKKELLIKVCGMRDAVNIEAVDALGIDLMGFIFFERSPRNVSVKPATMPSAASRVGVFVNAPVCEMLQKACEFGLEYIQLHGKESREICLELKDKGFKVIKAFSIASASDLESTAEYEGICDYFLFDTKTELVGGSGRCFDWSVLEQYNGNTPFLLSGGIGPESIESLKAFDHRQLAGFDLNSRFETAPALKNVQAVADFVSIIRER